MDCDNPNCYTIGELSQVGLERLFDDFDCWCNTGLQNWQSTVLLEVAMREIEEETGLSLSKETYLSLVDFNNTYPDGRDITGSFYVLKDIEKSELKITEGSLIEIPLSQVGKFMHEMVPTTCFAISIYLQSIEADV